MVMLYLHEITLGRRFSLDLIAINQKPAVDPTGKFLKIALTLHLSSPKESAIYG